MGENQTLRVLGVGREVSRKGAHASVWDSSLGHGMAVLQVSISALPGPLNVSVMGAAYDHVSETGTRPFIWGKQIQDTGDLHPGTYSL